ncbi:MAG: FAD-dependent monooxygenase [Cyclobacteriaceae bacterium]
MNIDIIGAGIGGLTAAIALQKKGIEVSVFEQASKIKPVGAGIILANNAMQVYDRLGLREEIEESGNSISAMNITNAQLNVISGVDLTYFEEKFHVRNTAIHRGKLQKMLSRQLCEGSLHLNKVLSRVRQIDSGYRLEFEDGSEVVSQVLIGADGINSTVRNCFFSENRVRHASQLCWRGVTNLILPKRYQNELNEAWGKGGRFGFVQIAPEKVYWYALKTFKYHQPQPTLNDLSALFSDYHPIIREIIRKTVPEAIHTAEISDLQPIKKWHQNQVVLLGDAAHATTPNLGQGACQAIEDAFVLSECLVKYDVGEAFAKYQQLRMPKAHRVVNTSWTLGKLAHWQNPLAVWFRNQLMSMTPTQVNRKQSEKIFQLASV